MTIPDPKNRMAPGARRRGRPSNAETATRPPAEPAKEKILEKVERYLALECPHCRRYMTPRIENSYKAVRYAQMPCCGSRVRIAYDPAGRPLTVQLIVN